ncbi:hypothetical protein HNQ94_003563 [Salirhabdus euzebyi]|uniref:Uncharacterized protein n=1 Tax=Salirhabdus euzebyi TaxID=394506 RepID=A0A841Q9H0_9BACI|nr:hypothetical protein [Salirhabdus euzebyi]MBB6455068.1 hypothetical protein [Salirhabdus euzebyi]
MYRTLWEYKQYQLANLKVFEADMTELYTMGNAYPTEIYGTNEGYNVFVFLNGLEKEEVVFAQSYSKAKAMDIAKKELREFAIEKFRHKIKNPQFAYGF